MKILVTGGTGFVRKALVQRLLDEGHTVYSLVRGRSDDKDKDTTSPTRSGMDRLHRITGDLHDKKALDEGTRLCEVVIHLVGIIREFPKKGVTFDRIHVEGTRNLVQAAQKNGVSRIIHMSALGARAGAPSPYHRSKYEAEQIVKNSGIPSYIFQPSVIFGADDQFVNMLAILVKLPVTPVIGNGKYQLQPVALEAVTAVFSQAVTRPFPQEVSNLGTAPSLTYEAGGPQVLTYNEMLDAIGRALEKKVRRLHYPVRMMKPLIHAFERFPFFPITSSQLMMLEEGNICSDTDSLYRDFDVPEIIFEEKIRSFLK